MLGSGSPDEGAAGYVALEHVTGTLNGRSGGFVLQHLGSMSAGAMELRVQVVPGSGTGELMGRRRATAIFVVGQGRSDHHLAGRPGGTVPRIDHQGDRLREMDWGIGEFRREL